MNGQSATDKPAARMTTAKAEELFEDSAYAAEEFGAFDADLNGNVLVVNDLTIVLTLRGKLTIADSEGTLLFVATQTGAGIGIWTWRQSNWCWRRALRQSIHEAVITARIAAEEAALFGAA